MRASIPVLGVVCLLVLAACPEEAPPPPPPPPPPVKKAPPPDAGDAAVPDAGAMDGGPADGGASTDGGANDGGTGASDGGDTDGGGGGALDAFADVTTRPAGADIFLDDQPVGTSPAKVSVASGLKQVLKVSKQGFFPETKELEPASGETVTVAFTLKPAVVLHVTSDPPDASVTVNGTLALAATPGDVLAPPGNIEVAVSLPAHDTFSKKLKVKKGEQKLDVKLTPSVKVMITSKPTGAEVTVDGKPAGVTPLEVWLSSKGKYTVAVTKEGWSTVKKVISRPRPDDDPVDFALTDLELAKLEAGVEKALKAYDVAYEALERTQERVAANPALSGQLDPAEAAMQKATDALEEAQRLLSAAKAKRGLK
ncbi:MAG: PEGA domain-containing protein [Myxococcota bacterium]